MIAVTQAAADRGWVAAPSPTTSHTIHTVMQHITTVAVVEWYSLAAARGVRLTGFANVAEVVPCVGHVGDEHDPGSLDAVYSIDSGIWFPANVVTYDGGAVDVELPHAEPGGLALRLEPIGCPPGQSAGELCAQCNERKVCGIGSPASVVDWSGEIGRWDR